MTRLSLVLSTKHDPKATDKYSTKLDKQALISLTSG